MECAVQSNLVACNMRHLYLCVVIEDDRFALLSFIVVVLLGIFCGRCAVLLFILNIAVYSVSAERCGWDWYDRRQCLFCIYFLFAVVHSFVWNIYLIVLCSSNGSMRRYTQSTDIRPNTYSNTNTIKYKQDFEEIRDTYHTRMSMLFALYLFCCEKKMVRIEWNLICYWPYQQHKYLLIARFRITNWKINIQLQW